MRKIEDIRHALEAAPSGQQFLVLDKGVVRDLCDLVEKHVRHALYNWPIAIHIEGREDDWEGYVTAPNVTAAVTTAIEEARLRGNELIHNIHIGPPRAV
jgi:hypothetical protein